MAAQQGQAFHESAPDSIHGATSVAIPICLAGSRHGAIGLRTGPLSDPSLGDQAGRHVTALLLSTPQLTRL